MQALYFLAGSLVTSGVLMQAFNQGDGWLFAIIAWIVVTVGAVAAEYSNR